MTADERYLKDPLFRQLVDALYVYIKELKLTPTETREAAMLAQIKYEMDHPRPIMLSEDLRRQLTALESAGGTEK